MSAGRNIFGVVEMPTGHLGEVKLRYNDLMICFLVDPTKCAQRLVG